MSDQSTSDTDHAVEVWVDTNDDNEIQRLEVGVWDNLPDEQIIIDPDDLIEDPDAHPLHTGTDRP